jgi:succinyl-diaminopimelate desuccinylase
MGGVMGGVMDEPAVDLLLELLAQPCVTGEEGPIADWVAQRYERRGEQVLRVGNSVVVGPHDADRPVLLLVGHLDVVAPTPVDLPARRDGALVYGRGASDMKSGLAVAMDCFEDPALRAGRYALRLVAYAGEEGPHAGNELGDVLAADPDLGRAALAVVLEPTDLTVQLGCMGALHAEVTVAGRAAHSARPWHGDNALTKAGGLLTALHGRAPQVVEVDGLAFREVLTATDAWVGDRGGRPARNVVPDRFTVNVNYRYAPDKTPAEAEEAVALGVGGLAEDLDVRVAVVDHAPAGRPFRDAPAVAAFLAAVDAPVEPKQAWTDVARFSEIGVAALNYGPGLTAQAHQAGEHVPVANVVAARRALAGFLARAGAERAG